MEEQVPGPFRHLQFLSFFALLPVAAKAVAGAEPLVEARAQLVVNKNRISSFWLPLLSAEGSQVVGTDKARPNLPLNSLVLSVEARSFQNESLPPSPLSFDASRSFLSQFPALLSHSSSSSPYQPYSSFLLFFFSIGLSFKLSITLTLKGENCWLEPPGARTHFLRLILRRVLSATPPHF